MNSQKIANETLLRAPQNLSYNVLKKNHDI